MQWKVLSLDNHGSFGESNVEQFRVYVPGDLDRSSDVRAADIIILVNYVFKGFALAVPECAAKVNRDTIVTAADLIYMVGYVFRSLDAPVKNCP